MSICPLTLKSFDYYLKKLPMYLRSSEAFQQHFRIWYDMFVGYNFDNVRENYEYDEYSGIVQVGDTILSLLDIFDGSYTDSGEYVNAYLEKIVSLEHAWEDGATSEDKLAHPYGTRSDILDKIASIYGIRRNLTISYQTTPSDPIETSSISLDNEELLQYIKIQIIKNYCDGSYQQLQEYYAYSNLQIIMQTADEMCTCNLYLVKFTESDELTNLEKLFLAGELSVDSMGIQYVRQIFNVNSVLVWDKEIGGNYGGWDTATWL